MSLLIADQRAVRFDDDLVLVAIVDYGSLLVPWMKLQGFVDVSIHVVKGKGLTERDVR